ncbi:MAG: DUF2063 domain-containing protein [Woeseia sp.]|nr:putative DNA-binding domain-containing protein [Woeseia sp.]NNE61316.1 DUF2063 domain-containing protein [Woeseia sp.]
MAKADDFREKQYAFAAHIRDPEHNAAPVAIEERRLAIYRDLFFNNLHSLLSSTFPVLKKLYADEHWARLVRAFMVDHSAKTPYFLEIPQEFVDFLQNEYELQNDDLPFVIELAHYEWAELALSVSNDENPQDIDPQGDLLKGVPVKSVLAWSLAYKYPVHRINESFQPTEPGAEPTFLVVYRQPDDELNFMELNTVTAALLEKIEANETDATGRELIEQLGKEIGWPDPEGFLQHGAVALTAMRDKHILLGTKK